MLERLKFNVIQAPMAGGIVTPDMVSTVSNSGMLGMIPSGYLSIQQLEEFILKVKKSLKIGSVFGVNLFIEPFVNQAKSYDKDLSIVIAEEYLQESEVRELSFKVPKSISEEEYIQCILANSVPIVSTTFGLLSIESISILQKHNIEVIATVTSIEEAELAINRGIRSLVFQGFEAGGHQASFLRKEINRLSTQDLIVQAKSKFDNSVRIIASGGISPKNMKDYFTFGSHYVQMGSAFMMTNLSGLSKEAKEYITDNFGKNYISKNTTGRFARGVIGDFYRNQHQIYEFSIQHYHTSNLRRLAKQKSNFCYTSLWVGSNRDNLRNYKLEVLIKECIIQLTS